MARDTQTKISRLSQLSYELLAKYMIRESIYLQTIFRIDEDQLYCRTLVLYILLMPFAPAH